ncbi:MAG: CaiB/BaiF CoA transferase family protein [Desulfobaccales bacterium]
MDTKTRLPLESIVVLDLSRVLSGPYCTMMLGDWGAEIWKVEPPNGDDSRGLAPPLIGGESAYFLSVNRNKRDICLDLTRPEGREAILRLAARADVVIENFRPDLKKRLGIGYDEVSQRNPAVIYCSISGFGQDGPYKDLPGLDNIFQGMAGLMEVTGAADGPPLKAGERLADVITGINAAFGIMVALFHRQRTGEGQFLDLALVDCLVAAQAPLVSYYFATGQQPPRLGNGSLFSAPTNTFQTADRPINLCIFNEKHWAKLCQTLGRQGLMEDRRFKTNRLRVANAAAINHIVAQMLQERPAAEWLERLQAAGVPCGLVYTYAETFNDPQIRHNGMLQEIPHASAGLQKTIGLPLRLHKTPGAIRRAAPLLGQHSREILQAAGFDDQEIDALIQNGIVVQAKLTGSKQKAGDQ